jgi:S-formylglutathione hydrolase FrmB
VIHSDYIKKADSVFVFIPEKYSETEKFPVVFLLHGYSGKYSTWSEFSPLQEYSDKYNFIIVCPDGLYNSWYVNSPVIKDQMYESFFFTDLIPFIFQNYKADQDKIFITGLSMGGFGALHLFASHPEIFRSAGSSSGLLDFTNYTAKYDIDLIIGSQTDNYSMISRIDDLKAINKPIITDCGKQDPFIEENRNFRKLCKKNGVEIKFISAKGKHERIYWSKSIVHHFDYFYKLCN